MTIQTQTQNTVKTAPFRPSGRGLGTARHRQRERRLTASWESLAESAESVSDFDLKHFETEFITGQAAFVAGIDQWDPILTPAQQLGWQEASRDYQRGRNEGRWHGEGKLSQTAADRYRATGTDAYNAGFKVGELEAQTNQRIQNEIEQMDADLAALRSGQVKPLVTDEDLADADEEPVGFWESRFPFLF